MAAVLWSRASAATGANGDSQDVGAGLTTRLRADINLSAITGTTPTITYFLEGKGADGIYYVIWQSAAINAAQALSVSVGPGLQTGVGGAAPGPPATAYSVGAIVPDTVRLRWVLGGAGPNATFSAQLLGDA